MDIEKERAGGAIYPSFSALRGPHLHVSHLKALVLELLRMELLGLFGICVVGTLFPLVSPEASAVIYGKELGWHPVAVGVVGGAGQSVIYLLLYLAGGKLFVKWERLSKLVAKTRARYHTHLTRRFSWMTVFAATIGLPPAVAIAALAPGFGISLLPVMLILFGGRIVRLSLLAAGGEWMNSVWGSWL